MVHLVTHTTLMYFDVDNYFKTLKFQTILPVLDELLELSGASLFINRDNITPEYTMNITPIVTRFGNTTMDNIPTGVKCYVILKLGLIDTSKYIIPEFLMGRKILRRVFRLAEHRDIRLYAPSGTISAISLQCLDDSMPFNAIVDDRQVTLLC